MEHELSGCHQEKLRNAKKKEWNKLLASGAIKVLSKEESRQIMGDEQMKQRIVKSRFVITKADEAPLGENTELKCRWCIRGYLDPDLLHLDTEAPTLSSEGAAIALQTLASMKWRMIIADVEGAFLRGDELNRDRGRVIIRLPPGGIEGVDGECLIEAVKAVYGLADAPLAWYQSFTRSLESLGCRRSAFDQCIYYVYSKHGSHDLIGIVAVHVDDMIMGGNEEFQQRVLGPLKEKYPFKHWHEDKGTFLGKELVQLGNGDIQIS